MKKSLYIFFVVFLLSWCFNQINIDNNSSSWTKNELANSGTIDITEQSNSWNLDLSFTWNLYNDTNKYCILSDYCIPSELEINQEDWFYIANTSTWEYESKQEITYELSENYDYFYMSLSEFMSKKNTKISKVWSYYIKSFDRIWCWWSNLEQVVLDSNWKQVEKDLLDLNISKIKLWNVSFEPTLKAKGWFWQPLDSYNDFKIYREDRKYKIYENQEEFVNFVNDKVINEDKNLYNSYIALYKDNPEVYVFYNSLWYDDSSLRVVWLWTDESYLSQNIKENWDYMDLDITNKIIWYYGGEYSAQGIFDKDWNRINSVTKSQLPIFSMKKLNENWNYLVYFKDWYELKSFAEMCKPVVYYYSNDKEKNNLTIDIKKWDYFTTLIPEFNTNNWWDFESNDWNITVWESSYDYLYYSLVTMDYKHNNDWWIVLWDNIVEFFDDKLDKINFNKKEKQDFIDFWKTEYETWKYYFVSFKYKEELDKIVDLKFSKNVDNEFRVLLDSYELTDFVMEEKEKFLYSNVWDKFDNYLIKRFERDNNSTEVFEWGGVLIKKDETIIK